MTFLALFGAFLIIILVFVIQEALGVSFILGLPFLMYGAKCLGEVRDYSSMEFLKALFCLIVGAIGMLGTLINMIIKFFC